MAYSMYCKLFASLYQGTLRGRSNEILVFTNLLAHAGRDGTVDKHFRAIAEETGLAREDVEAAISVLESPDPESRSPDENGARIVRLDEHRVWGWRIVNYGKYRAIRSEEDRAEQNRISQQRWRDKQRKPSSADSKPDKPKEKDREMDKGEAEAFQPIPPKAESDEAFAEFWSAYPRKVGKGNAETAWKKHKCAAMLPKILVAVRSCKVSQDWTKEGGQFIPHPATWLNRKGWDDELPNPHTRRGVTEDFSHLLPADE